MTYETGGYLRKSDTKDGELLDQIKVLQEVQKQLAANQLTDITYYDVGDILNIEVMLEDKLLLKLGSASEMDYKLEFISKVLAGKKSGEEEFEQVPEEGTLDFSSPPALHTMSISIDKVKNEEAYLDYGSNQLQQTDNIAGGQQSEPLQTTPVETPEEQQTTEEQPTTPSSSRISSLKTTSSPPSSHRARWRDSSRCRTADHRSSTGW